MTDTLTEREAWLWLAAHLEAIGMPFTVSTGRVDGLCLATTLMSMDDCISEDTLENMHERIRAHLKGRVYFCCSYAVKPRIAWCLKFAEECER
jgi:hypothetical protein